MIKLHLPSLALDNNLPKFKKSWLWSLIPEYNQWSTSGTWAFTWITYSRITSTSISWTHLCITTYGTFTKSDANWIRSQLRPSHKPLILSKVDHCNSLLLKTTSYQLNKLECIQNMACWLVLKLRTYDRVTEPMSTLHWLCICERIQYNVVSIMFKCLKGNAPQYLIDLLPKKQNIRQLWSSTADICLSAFYKKTQAYNSSFASARPRIWNSPPAEVCKLDITEKFKRQL